MSTANNSSLIVDQLITYADWFFPGDIDFDRDLDYRYRIGIVNGSDEHVVVGMRRCVSNSSLSDHGESPPQGSPKPATRRKNKHAPTPPSGTPDKHERRSDDKPPPAPDKPPRPLTTATLNRHTYKAQKHEVNAELVNFNSDYKVEKPTSENSTTDAEVRPLGFDAIMKSDPPSIENNETFAEPRIQVKDQDQATKSDGDAEEGSREPEANNMTIGFEALNLRENVGSNVQSAKSGVESEQLDNLTQKPKPVPAEKPTTLERRRMPVAAPRNPSNIAHQNPGEFFKNKYYIYLETKKLITRCTRIFKTLNNF